MYNTLRTIIFVISTIMTYLVYPVIVSLTYLLISSTMGAYLADTYLLEIYSAMVLIFTFLTFAGLQAIVRQVLLYRHSKGNAIMNFPITAFALADGTIYYIVPFLVYLFPLFRRSNLNEVIFMKLGFFIITMGIFYIVLEFSKKRTKVYFLKDGLVVKGIDLRLDLPLPSPFINATGFYPYGKFVHYKITDTTVELQLPAETGKIKFSFDPDEKEGLKQFLMMMEVPQEISYGNE